MSNNKILIAHPSPDLYGSDLQLLESVSALASTKGIDVTVVVPRPGPLVDQLELRGAAVRIAAFPVLRRSVMTMRGLPQYAAQFSISLVAIIRLITEIKPSVVYVNTVTIPEWTLVSRILNIPILCHVHEAISDFPKPVRMVLAGQLILCKSVVVNSGASLQAIVNEMPSIEPRSVTIYNGVPGPNAQPSFEASWHAQQRTINLALVGRMSPRKGTDVALSALKVVRAKGFDVQLTICGTVFEGYEWYEDQLRLFVDINKLNEFVTFSGYVNPTWPILIKSDIVLVPSRLEPFGNTAVEAQLAGRPLIASNVQGLAEIVDHNHTGLHAMPGDECDLASKIIQLIESPLMSEKLARAGWESADARFGVTRYREEIVVAVGLLIEATDRRWLSGKDAKILIHKLRKVKYTLRLPEIKRNVNRLLVNRVSAIPGFPQWVRVRAARAAGIEVGNSRIGALVEFSNENVVIGERCRIGRGVRFEGIGRIWIGDDVLIGKDVILTTRIAASNSSGAPPTDSMLRVDKGTSIKSGERISPKDRETC